MSFIDRGKVNCINIAEIKNMARNWKAFKVLILIGILYAGFYLFNGYKNLKRIVSSLQPKIFNLFRTHKIWKKKQFLKMKE
jgi:hypothetical protein